MTKMARNKQIYESVKVLDRDKGFLATTSVIDVKNIIANSNSLLRMYYFFNSRFFYISKDSFTNMHYDLAKFLYMEGIEDESEFDIDRTDFQGVIYVDYLPNNALSIVSIPIEDKFQTKNKEGVFNVTTDDGYNLGYEYENHYILTRDLYENVAKECPLFNNITLKVYEEIKENLPFKDEVSKNTLKKRQEWARKLDTKGSMGSFYSFSPMGEDYLNEEPDNSHLQPVPEEFKIVTTKTFDKCLKKIFPPISIKDIENYLKTNSPESSLGSGLYKIRFINRHGGKGQRGGYRIIYLLVTQNKECWLLTLYSKNDKEDISLEELKAFKEFANSF